MRHKRTALAAGLAGGLCLVPAQPVRCGQANGTSAQSGQVELCQDSQGGSYSPGAVVNISGKTMQCVVGPHWVLARTASANVAADVLDIGDTNVNADHEAAILTAFRGTSLPTLECDAVLNSEAQAPELTRVPTGEKRLVMFWTPTCGPCKPLLTDMAALADKKLEGLSVLGIVQSGDSELEPLGEWQVLRVKQLVARYKVGFPTCVHSSRELMKRWHAQGVPLTLLVSVKGVERVAAGGRNGQRLVAELAGQR